MCDGVGFCGQTKSRCGMATGAAGNHRHIGMVPGWQPTAVSTLVAGGAAGCGRDVVARLAGGRCAVVATGTVGRRGERAVVYFGATPRAGGLVAAFANRDTVVHRGVGFGRQAKSRCGMATGAAGNHRHIGMVPGRQPAAVSTLVAGGAAGCGRDVVGGLAGGCYAVVACGTTAT